MYCVLVAVDLPLQKDEVKCLNIIQDNRGKTVPGYLTLFQRCSSIRYPFLIEFLYFDITPITFKFRLIQEKYIKF